MNILAGCRFQPLIQPSIKQQDTFFSALSNCAIHAMRKTGFEPVTSAFQEQKLFAVSILKRAFGAHITVSWYTILKHTKFFPTNCGMCCFT